MFVQEKLRVFMSANADIENRKSGLKRRHDPPPRKYRYRHNQVTRIAGASGVRELPDTVLYSSSVRSETPSIARRLSHGLGR